MEQKDINEIATAVSGALAKLNVDTKAAEGKDKKDETPGEVFKCPDCDGEVAGGIMYCQHCGCALEWED